MSSLVETPARRAIRRSAAGPPGVAAALAVVVAACAHGGKSAPGSSGWVEHRSTHFLVDVPAAADADAAHVVGAFEELHAAIAASLAPQHVEMPGRIRVVLLPSRAALAEVTGAPELRARFWVSRGGEPTLVLAAEDVADLPPGVAHDLARQLAYHVFPRQPRWFAEALGRLAEGVAKVDAQGRRWAGSEAAAGAWLASMDSLFAWRGDDVTPNAEATSWVLYAFLSNERGAQLAELQRRLAAGEAPGDAWNESFPEWGGASGGLYRLDEALTRNESRSRPLRRAVEVRAAERSFTTAPASRGDVRVLLLELGAGHLDAAGRARLLRGLEDVLREDPSHAAAIAWKAELDGAPALPALRAAVAARPGDGRAWLWLAQAAEEAEEAEAALQQAIALWPEGVLPRLYLAGHLAKTGRAREALPIANRAVELAPWHPGAIGVLAQVAMELGNCREALQLQARAADVADAGGAGAAGFDGQKLRHQVGELRGRCEARGP